VATQKLDQKADTRARGKRGGEGKDFYTTDGAASAAITAERRAARA
jgi:hypothetical protein